MDSEHNDHYLSSTFCSSDISPAVEKANSASPTCPKFGSWRSPEFRSYTTTNDSWPRKREAKEQRFLSGHWNSSPGIDLSDNFTDIFNKVRSERLSYACSRKLDLKENGLVTINVGAPHHGNFGGVTEKIPKEEAICRFCFNVYKYNMLQTKCECEITMIHESCAAEWSQKRGNNKCHVCEQDIQNIPITVSSDHSSSSTQITKSKGLKTDSYTTRKRLWSYFCFSC